MVTILVGIPCSGKSTWCEKEVVKSLKYKTTYPSVLSRDAIRIALFGNNYKQNSAQEDIVTEHFTRKLEQFIFFNDRHLIVDNTHCKEKYIDDILKKVRLYSKDRIEPIKVQIIFFDIPLYKAYYRNIVRYLGTGKWIPFEVIKAMKKNFDKIDRKKYE